MMQATLRDRTEDRLRQTPAAARLLCLLPTVLLCILVYSLPARALTVQVMGETGGNGDAFVAALSGALGEGWHVRSDDGPADVVIALHEGALPAARATGHPVLALLPAPGTVLRSGETALYWAPSLTDQLRLAMQIFPGLRRAGILVGSDDDAARLRSLHDYAEARQVSVSVRVTGPDLLVRHVAELAAVTDVLIAPVDPRLFNRDTIKPVLLAAYRQNRGLIGPGPAFVRAGALATLSPAPEDLAAAAADRVRAWARDHRWPAPGHLSRFDVLTNPQVARALGLHLPDRETLLRALRAEDSSPWP